MMIANPEMEELMGQAVDAVYAEANPENQAHVDIQRRIEASDHEGVMARHEHGCVLLAERDANGGKQLPRGRMSALVELLDQGEAEIRNRMKFAERYEAHEVPNALGTFGTWHSICKDGLYEKKDPAPAPAKNDTKPQEPPTDDESDDDTSGDDEASDDGDDWEPPLDQQGEVRRWGEVRPPQPHEPSVVVRNDEGQLGKLDSCGADFSWYSIADKVDSYLKLALFDPPSLEDVSHLAQTLEGHLKEIHRYLRRYES